MSDGVKCCGKTKHDQEERESFGWCGVLVATLDKAVI